MPKVSSNAGKHPYLRTDEEEYKNLFSHLKFGHGGVPISRLPTIPKCKAEIETEYVDKNNEIIHFRDTIIFHDQEYVIDYRDQWWVMVCLDDPRKIQILRQNAHETLLHKRYN